jgi:hypothetical protein
MISKSLPLLLAAVLVGGTLAPAPARAEKLGERAASASAEAEALGVQIAHLLFAAMDMKALFMQEMRTSGDMDDFAKVRPNWPRFMAEATAEELDAKMPRIESLVGHAMAGYFTVEEMRAGVVILGDPEMQRYIRRRSADDSESLNTKALAPATRKTIRSGVGQAFLEKFGEIDTALDPVTGELGALIIPGVFRRFADKADADAPKAAP